MSHQDIRISTFEDVSPNTTDDVFVFGIHTSVRQHRTKKEDSIGVRWVDGRPVSINTALMAQEFRKVNPRVKFAGRSVTVSSGEYAYGTLWVYLPGQDVTMGWIGYGTHGVNKTVSKYVVCSRKIKNEKVASWRDQYHMVATDDIKRAVKNACKYLVPWTDHEIAEQSFGEFQARAADPLKEVVGTANKFLSECSPHRVLRAELKNLIRQGASFVTDEFKTAAVQFLQAEAEAEAEKLRKVGGLYVRVFEQAGRQVASVLTLSRNVRDPAARVRSTDPVLVMDADDLSTTRPDVAAKIAVLTTMSPGTYVPNVGERVAAGEFWVEIDL